MNKPAAFTATIFLGLIGLGQLVRFILGLKVEIDGVNVPVILSLPIAVVLGGIAVWLWVERKKSAT